jgi:hypothetical protein
MCGVLWMLIYCKHVLLQEISRSNWHKQRREKKLKWHEKHFGPIVNADCWVVNVAVCSIFLHHQLQILKQSRPFEFTWIIDEIEKSSRFVRVMKYLFGQVNVPLNDPSNSRWIISREFKMSCGGGGWYLLLKFWVPGGWRNLSIYTTNWTWMPQAE